LQGVNRHGVLRQTLRLIRWIVDLREIGTGDPGAEHRVNLRRDIGMIPLARATQLCLVRCGASAGE